MKRSIVDLDSEGHPMRTRRLRLVETEHAFLSRRFEEEMAASRASPFRIACRAHAEMACRYAVLISELENKESLEPELPFTFDRRLAQSA
jgi:hypothetical protein